MRSLKRKEHDEAVKLLKNGMKPAEVSRKFNLPISTVTTWNRKVRAERRAFGGNIPELSSVEKRKLLIKTMAKAVNSSEAKITTTAALMVPEAVNEKQWNDFQKLVETELKNLVEKCYDTI